MWEHGNIQQPYQAQNISNYFIQNMQIRPIMQNPMNMQIPMNIQNPMNMHNPLNMRNPINMQYPMNIQIPMNIQNPMNMQNQMNMHNPMNMKKNQNTQNIQRISNNQKIVPEADFLECNKAVPLNIIIKASKSVCKIAIRGNFTLMLMRLVFL